jgi:hypothetical protein
MRSGTALASCWPSSSSGKRIGTAGPHSTPARSWLVRAAYLCWRVSVRAYRCRRIGPGVFVPACPCWRICTGVFVPASLCWRVCTHVAVPAYPSWRICAGVSVPACRCRQVPGPRSSLGVHMPACSCPGSSSQAARPRGAHCHRTSGPVRRPPALRGRARPGCRLGPVA